MAPFNPTPAQGQDNMPNWTKVTSPISQPEADKSSGIALSSAGQSLDSGVSLVDQIAKDWMKRDVKNTVEPIREDFTNQLIAAKDQLSGSSVVPAPVQTAQGSTAQNILPTNTTAPPPAGVKSGLDKVQSIQLAFENGKVNDTYYDMRLKEAVTGLRAKYGQGYSDYIDSEVSKITGINPANALVGNLMQDINRLQTNKKTAVDTAINDAMKSGYPNSQAMVKNLTEQGEGYLNTFRQWYSKETMIDSDMKRREAIRKANTGKKEDVSADREADFNNWSGAKVGSALDAMTTVPGINTPGKVLDIMADAAANPGKYNDDQMRQLAIVLGMQKSQFESEARAEARRISKDDNGRSYSYYSDVGNSKIDGAIESRSKSFDGIIDALTKGGVNGVGVAYAQAIHSKAVLDVSKDNLLSDKDLGEYAKFMANSRELFGDNWTNLAFLQGLKDDVDKKVGPYLQQQKLKARAGFNTDGTPVTAVQQIDEGKALEQAGKITANMRARYTAGLVNILDDLKNPEAPTTAKEKVVKYLFSPEGQGILNRIKTDYTDPITNKFIPGKYSVFTRLSSDAIVSEVKKMGPEYQQMYKGYLEREAGAELFQKEFLNLNHFTGHDNLHFKYNDGGTGGVPHIELINNEGALVSPVGKDSRTYTQRPPAENYVFQVQKIVDRINSGLSGMSRVEKGFGGNANEYILDFLVNKIPGGSIGTVPGGMGVDMSKNWSGLPSKLIDAIAASRTPARRIEDTFSGEK